MKNKELSIIVTHHQTPPLLKLCLNSIQKNLDLLNYEIIVVDSQTDEETPEMMREFFPEIDFLTWKQNVGFSKIVNAGLKKAKGRFILIINADIIIPDNSLKLMLKYLKKHQKVGLLGPKLLNINNKLQPSCFRFYSPLTILYRRTFLGRLPRGQKHLQKFTLKEIVNKNNKPFTVDWLMGSALLTKKEAVKKVGFFDENFFMYFEDVDWSRRFWQAGYQVVYFPQTIFYHFHGRKSKKYNALLDILLNPFTRTHLKSAFKYFKKYGFKTIHYGQ